jgi:hypothetical protein
VSDSQASNFAGFRPTVSLSTILIALAAASASQKGSAAEGTKFRRGDVTGDGEISLVDPVVLLGHLFLGAAGPGCADAADADDSGELDISDPLFVLQHLFLGGNPPPAPYPACGPDPTADSLGCAGYPPCSPVFDRSRLHEVEITVSPEDLVVIQTPPPIIWPAPPEPWISCTFRFDDLVLAEVGIRRKGSSTLYQAADKYSWSVKFNKFVSGRRLRGLEKLILNNCVMDPTFLNEAIGYGVYRRMGLPAPLTAHTRLSLNGRSMGIYLVKESIDEDFLERTFGEGNGRGNLYEGPGDFLPRDPNFPDDFKEPELKDEDQGRVRDDLRELKAALMTATPSSFLAEAGARLDLQGFIEGWAVDSSVLHFDGYPGNYYLYHDPVSSRFVFIPHGMDQLFGFREWTQYDPVSGIPVGVPEIRYLPRDDPFSIRKGGGLVVKLVDLPEAWRRYGEAVRRVAREAWNVPAILAEIDQAAGVFAALRGASGRAGEDAALFEKSVGDLRAYFPERKAYLESITAR